MKRFKEILKRFWVLSATLLILVPSPVHSGSGSFYGPFNQGSGAYVDDDNILWGTGPEQVSLDDVPDGVIRTLPNQDLNTTDDVAFNSLALTNPLAVIYGGTGAVDANGARTNLGVAIGSDVQAYDSDLDGISGLTTTGIVSRTGAGAYTTLSDPLPVVNGGTGSATQSGARTNLGLVIGSDIQGYDSDLDGISGLSTVGVVSRTGAGTYTTSPFTSGSIPFADVAGLITQDNANLFYDDTNNRLGIGTAAPGTTLQVVGTAEFNDTISSGTLFAIDHIQSTPNPTDVGDTALGVGFQLDATSTGDELVLRAMGLGVQNSLLGGGVIQNIRSFNLANTFDTGTTTTNAAGIYLENVGTGTVTNYIGLHVAAVPTGAVKSWGIYDGVSAQWYLGGRLGIGITEPIGKLQINGVGETRDNGWESAIEINGGAATAPAIIFADMDDGDFAGIVGTTNSTGNTSTDQVADIYMNRSGTEGFITFDVNDDIGTTGVTEYGWFGSGEFIVNVPLNSTVGTGSVKIESVYTAFVDKGDQSTGTTTFDWSDAGTQRVRLTGNITIAFTNPAVFQRLTLYIVQDATGGRTVTWPTNTRWLGGTGATDSTTDAPSLSGASKADFIVFIYDNTLNLYFGAVGGLTGAQS